MLYTYGQAESEEVAAFGLATPHHESDARGKLIINTALNREGAVCPDNDSKHRPAWFENSVDGYRQAFQRHDVDATNIPNVNGYAVDTRQ